MIGVLPLASRAASPSTLAPLASRIPSKVDPVSLRLVSPLRTIVAQQDRIVMPAPTLGPVIKGGGSGLPGVAAPPANAAIQAAPTPTATPNPVASSGMPATGNSGGGASSPTDLPATDPTPGAGYSSGAPSFSASSFTSPVFLVGAGLAAAAALYFLTRKRR